MELIPFNLPFTIGKELEYISEAVLKGQLSGNGAFSRKCQAWLQRHARVRNTHMTPSGTAALEMAALLCDVKPGDEVILPSFTFVTTASAFVLRGATPVFVDITEDTLNIDVRLIERALTPKTRVIVPVHYAGVACDMDAIMAIAQKRDILVVEDAAQAFDSTYKGRACGSIGHLGAYSFHETKNCICGEGGALLVNDERFVERAEIIWEKGTNRKNFMQGLVDKYTWVDLGSSFVMSDLNAAYLYAQFERHDEILKKRREIFDFYVRAFKPLADAGRLGVPAVPTGCVNNGHIFYLLMESQEERNRFIAFMKERKVMTVFHYIPLHDSPMGKKVSRPVSLPVTEDIAGRLVRLPLYFRMTEEDMNRVADAVHEWCAR